jgi:signal transduction histidine kinase
MTNPSPGPLLPYLTTKPSEEIALEQGLLTGVAAFRWAAWGWAATLLVIQRQAVTNLALALAVLGAALLASGTATVLLRTHPERLLTVPVILGEIAIAVSFGITNSLVFDTATPGIGYSQPFGTVWPLACVLTAGIAFAGRGGLAAGVVVGLAGFFGLVFVARGLEGGQFDWSVVSSMVLYALGGAVAGYVTAKLRESEREIAVVRAREEVARTLHDGVLQTLAIVQRRATDDDLVALAREQEHELREFLFSPRPDPKHLLRPATADLGSALRSAALAAERRYGLRSQVVIGDELRPVADAVSGALTGAISEALTNSSKHGHARQATIFVEPADGGGIFCSVKDDGTGFSAGETTEGVGITRSIRGRITDIGGTVEIDGRPGRGTEVRFWVPM